MKRVERCPCCGDERLLPFALTEWVDGVLHFAQARCAGCGMLVSQPQADPEDVDRYYRSEYYQSADSKETRSKADDIRWIYERYDWPIMNSLWRNRPPPPGADVVEVGCGLGVILDLFKENGFRTHGCDLSPEAVAWCRARGHDAVVSPFPQSSLPRSKFAVVCALQVIEHTLDLKGFVQELVDLAAPGGVVVVATESIWTTQHRVQRLAARLRGRCFRFHTHTSHTLLMQASHVGRLMEDAGCEGVESRYYTQAPAKESLHWRMYKGTMRLIDRLVGGGECHMTVAWKKSETKD